MSRTTEWTISCLFFFYLLHSSITVNYLYYVQNYVNLVSAYNVDGYSTKDFPPVFNMSRAMVVTVNMFLYAINGFDEVAGNIEIVAALEMKWTDEMPIIQSITFRKDRREEFLVPYDMIWTPRLVLTNAIGDTSSIGDQSFLCRFNMINNTVTWKPRVVMSASCTPDVTYYPFDKQECKFIYTPWGFKHDEVRLQMVGSEWNMAEYDESGEWNIIDTTSEVGIQENRSQITFTLRMIRKPLYFAFNILLPILVLCLLNATVFLLPAESGERVGFSVTCFLSFMVLLNMIMDIMPRSSNPISFLCYYLVVMMSNSGAMTLVTILLMRVYHKPEKDKVPLWMQRAVTFLNCGCARLRCCVLCCRFLRAQCCCKNKRRCGCSKKSRSISEETLTEISIDKDNQVVERTIKKKKVTEQEMEDDLSVKPESCCCLGCFKKCSKPVSMTRSSSSLPSTFDERQSKENQCHVNHEATEAEKSGCFCCLGKKFVDTSEESLRKETPNESGESSFGKRITEQQSKEQKQKNDSNDKAGCFVGLKKSDKKRNAESNHSEDMKSSSDQVMIVENSHSSGKPKVGGCRPAFKNKKSKQFLDSSVETPHKKEKADEPVANKDDCFAYLRKVKVSSYDEVQREENEDGHKSDDDDLAKYVLPDTNRHNEEITQKVSFQAKENLDTEEVLIKRWEDMTGETSNKKGRSLTPIDLENSGEELMNNNVTLKTKSIRARKEDKETPRKDETRDKRTARDQRTRELRTSVRENMPKPVVTENVNVPDSKSSQSKVSKVSIKTSEVDSEDDEEDKEDDIDSLADLEEEVAWHEVGRILDTFCFLAFSGGQAFITVVFLVPLFTETSTGK